jgi:predicted small secreted protein
VTGYVFTDIILAAIVTLVVAAVASVLIIRDYALKYRQAVERGKKISKKTTAKQMLPIVGSHVKFQDETGVDCDAVVIAIHNPNMFTLAVIGSDNTDRNQDFRDIEKDAFTAHGNIHPLYGFNCGYTEEELRSYGVTEKYNELLHYSHVN